MTERTKRWRNRWVEHWWLDLVIAALATAAIALVTHVWWAPLDILGSLHDGRLQSAYEGLISISTFLAGFTSVAFASYLGMSSKIISQVEVQSKNKPLQLWIASIVVSWGATIAVWVSGVLDDGGGPSRWVAVWSALVVIGVVARSAWLLAIFAGLASLAPKPTVPTSTIQIGINPTRRPARPHRASGQGDGGDAV